MSKNKNHYVEKSSSPRRFKVIFMYTDQYIRISLHATVFLPLFSIPPPFGGFYTLYRPFLTIWALHLLIIQASTWAPIPSNTSFSSLWAALAKATLFRGLLHINAARKVVVVHSMWWWQLFLRYFVFPSLDVRPLRIFSVRGEIPPQTFLFVSRDKA